MELGVRIGIIRELDKLGRLVIPREVYNHLNLKGKTVNYSIEGCIIYATYTDNITDRKIDRLGRITVPTVLKKTLGWKSATVEKEGTAVEMFFYEFGIGLVGRWENNER